MAQDTQATSVAPPQEELLEADSETIPVRVPSDPNEFHLFLLVGQSNMAGRGNVAEEDLIVHDRVLSLNKEGQWIHAVDPLHFDKPKVIGVGPGRTFALDYAKAHPAITVGIVPCAAGGSPIDSWQPGGYHSQTKSHPYDDAIRRARAASQAGMFKGILWHQGESDSKETLASKYEEKLDALIKRFRAELSAPSIPFLIGQLGNFAERPWNEYKQTVDRAHKTIASRLPAVEFVSSDGLAHKGDEVHFDSESAKELGHRYYSKFQSIPKLVGVRRIWDKATHNAFTDLVRFGGEWFCVFREGKGHVSPDGSLRVLTSADAIHWKSAALIQDSAADLRDAKLTVTPDGRLMLSGAGAMHDTSQFKHQSMAWFSNNGKQWSSATEIGERDYWLWRTTWFSGDAYSVGYQTNTSAPDRHVRLYKSTDGKKFEVLVDRLFSAGYPNETSLRFQDDGTCYCLLRRDHDTKTGQLGVSSPPYTQWQWKDLDVRIGGPHMIFLPDGRVVAAVRLYDDKVRTSLCWLDLKSGSLREFMTLPSGGDTSYPGLVWHNDALWVSYYSSHESNTNTKFKSAIYLAQVQVPELASSK